MKKLRYLPVFLALFLLGSDGCRKFDLNTDELDLQIGLDIIKTNINLTFTDPASGAIIGEDPELTVRVVIYGADSAWVLDPSGKRYSEFLSAAGRLSLALDPYNAVPTEKDPVVFVVYAEADGYMPAGRRIELSTEGEHHEIIQMIKETQPPSGMVTKIVTGAGKADAGRVLDSIVVGTDSGSAIISLLPGTVLTDEKGNLLDGSLTVSLHNFSVTDNQSRESFPGGFTGAVDSAGVLKEVGIETAAFFKLDITDPQKRRVHQISNGQLNAKVWLDPEVINPKTGQPLKDGDEIGIYSYNERSGVWKFEGTTVVSFDGARFTASTLLPHLTYFNFGWQQGFYSDYYMFSTHYGYSDGTAIDDKPVNYKVKFSFYRGGIWLYYGYVIFQGKLHHGQGFNSYNPDPQRFFRFKNFYVNTYFMLDFVNMDESCGETRFSFWNTPDPLPYQTRATAFEDNTYHRIWITPREMDNLENAAVVNVVIHCSDTRQRVIPNQGIFARFRPIGSSCWRYRYVYSGYTTIYGIQPAQGWEIQVQYQNRWQPSVPYQYYITPDYHRGTTIKVTFDVEMKCN